MPIPIVLLLDKIDRPAGRAYPGNWAILAAPAEHRQEIAMKIEVRRPISMPLIGLFGLVSLLSFGWLLATFLAAKFPLPAFERTLVEFTSELARVVLVGSSAGLIVDLYLRRIVETGREAIPRKSGIQHIYDSRSAAADDLLSQVQNSHTRKIEIAGLSLRDLLTVGALQNVWDAIWQRLKDENEKNMPDASRLHVRILLLNPQSIEGTFRRNIEKGSITGRGLQYDVQMALSQIDNVQKVIYGREDAGFLQVKLFDHSSFGFSFITNSAVFTEQYGYIDPAKRGSLPLIKYERGTDAYAHFLHSFNVRWENARVGRLANYEVGFAEGVQNAGIMNIYRHNVRHQLGLRQIECIGDAKPGDVVCIQAITGKFYTQSTAANIIRDISYPPPDGDGKAVTIRILIINPVSQQAILRAVADSGPQDQMGTALKEWSWELHRKSPLYTDATQVMRFCGDLQKLGCHIELRLTPAPLTSSLLLTPCSAFIEQYVYGRSKRLQKGIVLGAEYPVLEFDMKKAEVEDKVEQEILRTAFDVMWNQFSVKLADYKESTQEQDFRTSLSLVRASSEEGNASGIVAPGPHPVSIQELDAATSRGTGWLPGAQDGARAPSRPRSRSSSGRRAGRSPRIPAAADGPVPGPQEPEGTNGPQR
jgi:hypothetical protein